MGSDQRDLNSGRTRRTRPAPANAERFQSLPAASDRHRPTVDDKYLYVSCWGTGDFHQYDVSDPFKPKLTGKLRIGGICSRAAHPKGNGPLNGGPQMVEVSRDGRRIYFTNSLYSAVDDQFYPDGIKGWMVKVNARPEGGIAFDEDFFLAWPEGYLPHQVRLQGGDASSDSYCYPSN